MITSTPKIIGDQEYRYVVREPDTGETIDQIRHTSRVNPVLLKELVQWKRTAAAGSFLGDPWCGAAERDEVQW